LQSAEHFKFSDSDEITMSSAQAL